MVGAYQQLKKRVILTGLKLALSWKKHTRHYGNFCGYYENFCGYYENSC